jgi:hypothetical protein
MGELVLVHRWIRLRVGFVTGKNRISKGPQAKVLRPFFFIHRPRDRRPALRRARGE